MTRNNQFMEGAMPQSKSGALAALIGTCGLMLLAGATLAQGFTGSARAAVNSLSRTGR
jgi:hypothetical protein